MSYIITNRKSELNTKQDDLLASKRFVVERKPETIQFYELEAAVVLDVILNEDHPAFSGKKLDPNDWPNDINDAPAEEGQPNYGWIGMVKFRFLNSQVGDDKTQLSWALPIENTGMTEYPLMNEVVIVGKYLNNYYYSRKLNLKSLINANASFELERTYGQVEQNTDEYTGKPYTGPTSILNGGSSFQGDNPNYVGVLGSYFGFNPSIRAIKRYEGDTIIESRFGQSIRFGSYDEVRANDSGLGEYSDQGGNPRLLIRNRQAPVKGSTENSKLLNKGYVTESINNDGSSFQMLSGKTISDFITTVKKVMVSGVSQAASPTLNGDQILINSDRLVLSAKANEMLCFSKKRMSLVTDDEITIDAKKKITITSEVSVSINAPKIYLGRHAMETQPVLKGRTTCLWLSSMCDWMLLNVNSQIKILTALITFGSTHTHIGNLGKPTTPSIASVPPMAPIIAIWSEQLASLNASQVSLTALKMQIDANMSNRVFGA